MAHHTQIELPSRILEARYQHAGIAAYLSFALLIGVAASPANAQQVQRSGKTVVDTVCATCHATGANGAPRIGDQDAWRKRASQGLSSLTRHALSGIRNMPAHGGRTDLSDLEIARAITYMVNRSGGNWVEPLSVRELATERSGEMVVNARCIKCHEGGVGGAPRIGDLKAWVPRVKKGFDYLVHSATHGHGGMPPRGGQADLTDAELRAAILYMYNPSATPAKVTPTAKAAKTGSDPNHVTVGDVDIYLGFVSTQQLRALPKGSPERTMHGGLPQGSGYYHVNVSIFDKNRHAPINDAEVQMRYTQPGLATVKTELAAMMIGRGSYGNFIRAQTRVPYLISLKIKRPAADGTIEAHFEHTFQ